MKKGAAFREKFGNLAKRFTCFKSLHIPFYGWCPLKGHTYFNKPEFQMRFFINNSGSGKVWNDGHVYLVREQLENLFFMYVVFCRVCSWKPLDGIIKIKFWENQALKFCLKNCQPYLFALLMKSLGQIIFWNLCLLKS